MKKLFLILTLIFSVAGFSQGDSDPPVKFKPQFALFGFEITDWSPPPANYILINQRYRWLAGMFDNGLTIPSGADAADFTGQWPWAGSIYVDTTGTDSGFYYKGTGRAWQRIARAAQSGRFGVTGEDVTATANRTFDISNYTFILKNVTSELLRFDTYTLLASQKGGSNNLVKVELNGSAPDNPLGVLTATDSIGGTSLFHANARGAITYTEIEATHYGRNSKLTLRPDSIWVRPSFGRINIDTLEGANTDTVRWKPVVWNQDNGQFKRFFHWGGLGGGGGSGTVNSGLLGKPAYYITNPSGTVVDDFAPIDLLTSGNLWKITAQAATDIPVTITMHASQSATPFVLENSAGTDKAWFTKDGYLVLPGDTYPAEVLRIGTTNGAFTGLSANGVGFILPATGEYGVYTSAGSKVFVSNSSGFTRFGSGSFSGNFTVEIAGNLNISSDVMAGSTNLPDRALHVEKDNATTNAVTNLFRLTQTSSGTPANGIGIGVEFETETTAANNEIGNVIESVVTDVTATSEDFDLVVKNMSAGAAATERFRVNSVGYVTFKTDAVTPVVMGTIHGNTTDVGNILTGVDDLMSYTVPANTLINDGDALEFEMFFTTASNTNSKSIAVGFGGTQISFETNSTSGISIIIKGKIIRVSNTSQRCVVSRVGGTSGPEYTLTAITLSNSAILKATGEGVATNDIVQKTMHVQYVPFKIPPP